jgi:hypothetical protein
MLTTPDDLLYLQPDAFLSDSSRRTATAFQQAWVCLAPLVSLDKIVDTRRQLAELTVERAKHHGSLQNLRVDVLTIALERLRRDQVLSH